MANSIVTTAKSVQKCALANASTYTLVMGKEGSEGYVNSLDGAIEIVWKYWDSVVKSDGTIKRHGYNELMPELGLNVSSFREFKALVKGLFEQKEGLNDLNWTIKTTTRKGVTTEEPCLGLWGTKNLEDKSVEPIIDAKGKATYPYVMGEDNKPIKVSSCKPITKWNTKILFDMLIQNSALNKGMLPYTEEMYLAEHSDVPNMESEEPIADAIAIGA